MMKDKIVIFDTPTSANLRELEKRAQMSLTVLQSPMYQTGTSHDVGWRDVVEKDVVNNAEPI